MDEPDRDPDEPAPAGHPAAMASNWRAVVGIDAAIGVAAVVVGVVLAIGSNLGAGLALVLIGSVYTTMVALRARRWLRMRRDARLD